LSEADGKAVFGFRRVIAIAVARGGPSLFGVTESPLCAADLDAMDAHRWVGAIALSLTHYER
jgi:hypothetical protein